MTRLTITKRGRFHVSAKHKFQCGAVGQNFYDYEIAITGCSSDVNSKNQFLFDNAILDSWFRDYGSNYEVVSCEKMAQDACNHFLSKMKEEGIRVFRIFIKIIPNETAFLSCEWTPELELLN